MQNNKNILSFEDGIEPVAQLGQSTSLICLSDSSQLIYDLKKTTLVNANFLKNLGADSTFCSSNPERPAYAEKLIASLGVKE